jgi:hypothetical protein
MYIGDVGQGAWEEVDYEPNDDPGGHNYGWRLTEGNHCYNPPSGCDDGSPVITYPIHEYNHFPPPDSVFHCSITGGYVYRGTVMPVLNGRYFFADYCADRVYSLKVVGGVATDVKLHTPITQLDGIPVNDIVAIGQDANGELYFVDRGAAVANLGEVFKLVPDPDFTGVTIVPPGTSASLQLSEAVPNPFRGSAAFAVTLGRAADLQLRVYSSSGRLLRRIHSGPLPAGKHTFTWDGYAERSNPVAAGVYFIRAEALGRTSTKRLTLLK